MSRTVRATVKVAGVQRERHFAHGTKVRIITAWKTHVRAQLLRKYSAAADRAVRRDRLAADAERYYPQIKHLSDWGQRRSEIRAWLKAGLADRHRHLIVRADVLRIRGVWIEAGVAPKSVNNRVTALRNLYHVLDGDDSPTPCDGVKPLPTHKSPPVLVPAATVNAVLAVLTGPAKDGRGRPTTERAQTAARLMVLASTGKRPSELMRAEPGDVDLERRVWSVRDGKGGWSEGAYLNTEMRIAWQAFVDADAWGWYSTTRHARRLRAAGWPDGVRPYNARHATWITASERGADLSDIQAGAGHRHQATTRTHYVPVLHSRMQRLSELLDGRFGWQARLADQQPPA